MGGLKFADESEFAALLRRRREQRPMKKKQIRIALIGCVVLGLIGGAIALLQPAHGLLDHAERIASVPDWTGQVYVNGSSPLYEWLNAEEVLFFRQEPGLRDFQGWRQKLLPVGQTGPPRRLPGVTYPRSDAAMKYFSARGDWIHQSRYDGKANTELEELVSLKDGRVRRAGYINGGVWSEDGGSIINLVHGTVVTYQAVTGTTSRLFPSGFERMPQAPIVPLSSFLPAGIVRGAVKKPAAKTVWRPDYMEVLFARPGERLIAVRRGRQCFPSDARRPPYMVRNENTTAYELYEFDLAHPEKTPRTWNIPTPKEATYGGIRVSPQGDRLLWVVSIDTTTGLDRLLHKGFPKLFTAERHIASYRISRLDGSGLREIVRLEIPNWYLMGAPALKWMPDGKHLSVAYKGVLYIIPVDN